MAAMAINPPPRRRRLRRLAVERAMTELALSARRQQHAHREAASRAVPCVQLAAV
jgi:hypothetical protein